MNGQVACPGARDSCLRGANFRQLVLTSAAARTLKRYEMRLVKSESCGYHVSKKVEKTMLLSVRILVNLHVVQQLFYRWFTKEEGEDECEETVDSAYLKNDKR